MPVLHFATPPTRDSMRQAEANEASSRSAFKLQPLSDDPLPIEHDQHLPDAEPLTFEKRTLLFPITPTAKANQVVLPLQLDNPPAITDSTHPAAASQATPPAKSLLSSALADSHSRREHHTLHLPASHGILKKDLASPTNSAFGKEVEEPAKPVAAKPKAHFAEPIKPNRIRSPSPRRISQPPSPRTHMEEGEADLSTPVVHQDKRPLMEMSLTEERVASLGAEPPVLTRRRCLVFQESSDVLERAAERAAKLAKADGDGEAWSRARGSRHSVSSAGEESCSTRSSWAARASSRTSSLGTSSSAGSAQVKPSNKESSEDEDETPSNDKLALPSQEDDQEVKVIHEPPKPIHTLKFAQSPVELAERDAHCASTYRLLHFSTTPRLPLSTGGRGAVSEDEVVKVKPDCTNPSKRSLSFSVFPHPQRDTAPGSKTHRPKLSASPAPTALPYKQRVRGIRGGGPILSPAPAPSLHKFRPSPVPSHGSGSASGNSKDEEDNSGIGEDEDIHSSFADGVGSGSEDDSEEADDQDEEDEEQGQDEDGQSVASGNSVDAVEMDLNDDQLAVSHRSDSKGFVAGTETSPRKALDTRGSRSPGPGRSLAHALAQKDSRTSHPICFLPETFEDSAPPSPALSGDADASMNEGATSRGPPSAWGSEIGSDPNSRRCSFQNVPGGQVGGATPILLPFHRGRDRGTTASGISLGEHTAAAHSLWRGPSWMNHPVQKHRHTPAGSPKVSDSELVPSSLGLTVNGLPARPINLRFSSSRSTAEMGTPWSPLRRNSHSMNASASSSALTESISAVWLGLAALSPRSPPHRPASSQRALSAASQNRCRPSMAQCSNAWVIGATSPPRETAWHQLRHCLDNPPVSPGNGASGTTTPASASHAYDSGAGASRYWHETLSALAHVMTDEIAHVSNAVLGGGEQQNRSDSEFGKHERSRSVPLESAIPMEPEPCSSLAPAPMPQPIRIASPEGSEVPHRHRHPARRSKTAPSHGSSPHRVVKREVGPDGQIRLTERRKRKGSMEFNWGKGRIPNE